MRKAVEEIHLQERRQVTETTQSNLPVLVTAARLRFLLKLKDTVWAAARDGGR
jgi:hypothetical protein